MNIFHCDEKAEKWERLLAFPMLLWCVVVVICLGVGWVDALISGAVCQMVLHMFPSLVFGMGIWVVVSIAFRGRYPRWFVATYNSTSRFLLKVIGNVKEQDLWRYTGDFSSAAKRAARPADVCDRR